ncbi:hypothetical protein GJ496_004846 [Pomphorhynchus laevis]|nr:hypothetical protein GJ496_004846 [Pomphorhynchus laevis]
MTKGTKVLGSAIGDREYLDSFINEKIENWLNLLSNLKTVSVDNPHDAFIALIQAIQSKWSFLQRTCKSNFNSYDSLTSFLVNSTIPSLTGVTLDDIRMEMMFLPLSMGGLGIQSPNRNADAEFARCLRMARPLLDGFTGNELTLRQYGIANEINKEKTYTDKISKQSIISKMVNDNKGLEFASINKASS